MAGTRTVKLTMHPRAPAKTDLTQRRVLLRIAPRPAMGPRRSGGQGRSSVIVVAIEENEVCQRSWIVGQRTGSRVPVDCDGPGQVLLLVPFRYLLLVNSDEYAGSLIVTTLPSLHQAGLSAAWRRHSSMTALTKASRREMPRWCCHGCIPPAWPACAWRKLPPTGRHRAGPRPSGRSVRPPGAACRRHEPDSTVVKSIGSVRTSSVSSLARS